MPPQPRQFDVLLTAAEAFPRLEAEFLRARQDIVAGFRVFDPWTQLRSEDAQAIGTTWFDLLCHTLNRGVRIEFTLSDFDPVVGMDMHLYAWRCLRGILAAAEASACPENLQVRMDLHPARLGLLPRTILWPRSVKEMAKNLAQIIDTENISAKDLLHDAPGLRPLVKQRGDTLKPRLFPPPPLAPVTHHQKLAVFDAERLYIGGLDLNDRRFDTPQHQRAGQDTWHDVQVLVTGPAAQEAQTHLRTLPAALHRRPTAQPQDLVRTISAKRRFTLPFMSPKPWVREIADAHTSAISRSTDLIYLETQFIRDEALARCLADRAKAAPGLSLVIMVPAAPEDIAFTDTWGADAAFGEHLQTKCIDILQDGFGDRLFIGSPARPVSHDTDGRDTHYGAPIIYLHAKVSIFDDHTAIVSSANLNGRSLNWDTEAGIATRTPHEVAQVKTRCFDHWLGSNADAAFFNGKTACDAWGARAASNARARPEDRVGFVLPYRTAPARQDAQALPGVPPEMA